MEDACDIVALGNIFTVARVRSLDTRCKPSKVTDVLFQASRLLAERLDGEPLGSDDLVIARRIESDYLEPLRVPRDGIFPFVRLGEGRVGFFYDAASPYARAIPREEGELPYTLPDGTQYRGFLLATGLPERTLALTVPFTPKR